MRILFISALVFLQLGLTAQVDTVKVGVFINDIYDINLSEKSFAADFWIWFNYKNPDIKPLETMEIPNAKTIDSSLSFTEEKEGIQWATKKVRATIKKDWEISKFPFDKQKLIIEVEESDSDDSAMVYIGDSINTLYDKRLSLPNWHILDFKIESDVKEYRTTYGDPTLSNASSSYPHATIVMSLERKSTGLFWTLFTGLYVAFLISILVFFIDPIDVDPRFGLSVGGLFAAVGNKYIVDSILPQSTTFTLVDKLHVTTYFFLLVCIFMSVISLYIWKYVDEKKARRLDRISFFVTLISFILLNLWFISTAMAD